MQHEAAQRGEDVADAPQPVMRTPWVRRESGISLTQILFGLNVAVFLAMLLSSGDPLAFANPTHEFPPQVSIHYGANFGPLTLSGDWWRLLTYMFLHGSLLHIGFNMWCLWDLGALCESLYGRWTYAAIYLLTGIAGGIASIGWNPRVWSVGASGAIFGLAGALIASFYLGEFSLPRIAIKGTLRSLLFFAGFNLLFGSIVPGIDNSAHIGGLVAGLILGALIARFAPHGALHRAAIATVAVLALAAAGWGVSLWRGGPMRRDRASGALDLSIGDRLERLRSIARKEPNSAQAHFELAQAYFSDQQLPQAEAEFQRVVELQPQNFEARFYLGVSYLEEKHTEEARSAFTQILAQDSQSAYGHYGLGLVLADQGNDQAAVEEFKVAAELPSRFSGINYEMGKSYVKLKNYDEAIAAFSKEREENGDAPEIENALADAYQAKGMSQQAQEARDRAAKLRTGQQ